jgi:hypothetical protein
MAAMITLAAKSIAAAATRRARALSRCSPRAIESHSELRKEGAESHQRWAAYPDRPGTPRAAVSPAAVQVCPIEQHRQAVEYASTDSAPDELGFIRDPST